MPHPVSTFYSRTYLIAVALENLWIMHYILAPLFHAATLFLTRDNRYCIEAGPGVGRPVPCS